MTATPPRGLSPPDRIAWLADDRDFWLRLARRCLDGAEADSREIARLRAELAEREQVRRDVRVVSKLAGRRVTVATEGA